MNGLGYDTIYFNQYEFYGKGGGFCEEGRNAVT